jgi:hypothetical protein
MYCKLVFYNVIQSRSTRGLEMTFGPPAPKVDEGNFGFNRAIALAINRRIPRAVRARDGSRRDAGAIRHGQEVCDRVAGDRLRDVIDSRERCRSFWVCAARAAASWRALRTLAAGAQASL